MTPLLIALALGSHEDAPESRQPHLEAVASAVWAESARGPRERREWAKLLITIGAHESHFSIRIMRGECKKWECDRGRAKGMFQIHSNTLNRDSWALQDGDIPLQVKLASDALKRAYWTCARSGEDWLVGTINAYAGKRCGARWAGLDARIATFRSLR